MATNQEYKNANYDQMAIWVKKGKRAGYKQAATKFDLSLATFIQTAADEYICNHAGEELVPAMSKASGARQLPEISAAERKLLDNYNALPKSTQAKISALIADIADNTKRNVED